MSRQRTRPLVPLDVDRIDEALMFLRSARNLLRKAEAHHAADYVQRALKSAEGAARHISGLALREFVRTERAKAGRA